MLVHEFLNECASNVKVELDIIRYSDIRKFGYFNELPARIIVGSAQLLLNQLEDNILLSKISMIRCVRENVIKVNIISK